MCLYVTLATTVIKVKTLTLDLIRLWSTKFTSLEVAAPGSSRLVLSDLSWYKQVSQLIILLLQRGGLVIVALGQGDLLVQLHLGQVDLHVLLSVGQHDVARVVVHADDHCEVGSDNCDDVPEVIDEETRPDQVVEALHDGAGEEQHETPLRDEEHLTLDVESLVQVLQVVQLKLLVALVAVRAGGVGPQLVNLILGGQLKHTVQASLNNLGCNSQ